MIDHKKRAQAVILELVTRSLNKEFAGKTRLFKAFYLAHLFFARDANGYLTEWPIVRMPNGPGIGDFDELMRELVEHGDLQVEKTSCDGPYPEYRYRSDTEPDRSVLPEGAIDAISKSLGYIASKSASLLSADIHERSTSWKEGKDGDELNIYIDLMDEDDYKARSARSRENEDAVKAVFG